MGIGVAVPVDGHARALAVAALVACETDPVTWLPAIVAHEGNVVTPSSQFKLETGICTELGSTVPEIDEAGTLTPLGRPSGNVLDEVMTQQGGISTSDPPDGQVSVVTGTFAELLRPLASATAPTT